MNIDDLDALVRLVGLQTLRVVAAFWMLPIFGPRGATHLVRLGLGIVLGISVAIAKGLDPATAPAGGALALAFIATKEILLGLLLGFTAALILDAAAICGTLISTEMGINLADQVDPSTRHNVPLLAFLFQNLALVLFFSMGGHALVLGAILRSFETFPVGEFPSPERWAPFLIGWSTEVLATGVRIAAPVFFIMIVVTIGVGFLAKVAPNLGVLEASYPIRIIAALFLLVLFMPLMLDSFQFAFHELGVQYATFLEAR